MSDATPRPSPLPKLYVAGERLGWAFRDRNLFRYRFVEPYPAPPPPPLPVSPMLVEAANRARQRLPGRIVLLALLGVVLATVLGCCGGLVSGFAGDTGAGILGLVGLVVAVTVAGIVGVVLHQNQAAAQVRAAQAHQQRSYADQVGVHQVACAEWEQRRRQHETAERVRVEGYEEWGAVEPPVGTRRVDIVGGTIWGWEALLTVFGGSLLCTRAPVTVVDFTGEAACQELVRLAAETGISYDLKLLPSQLSETGLLGGLSTRQLVDTLIESMYGDVPTGSRADRAQDDRILSAVCGVLGENITMARLAAALRVLMGEPGQHDALSPTERATIADDLFTDEFKRQVHANLRRIESSISPLEALGNQDSAGPIADLTCLVDESDGRSARQELLKDLIVQWLIRLVSGQTLPARSLVLVGADEVNHLHLERLTDLCERRDIRLVLMFRHLRDASVRAIGGGAVGFMRLANHEEAREAAEFIGRHHKFVLSELTRTLGGNETHSVSDGQGQQVQRSTGMSGFLLPGGWHTSRSLSRNWNQMVSHAEGTSWNDAAAAQRVYEYAVEPSTLQALPDYALLFVTRQHSGSILQPVECNPEIVTMHRMTMRSLPNIPLPAPEVAAIPLAGSPTQLTVSRPAQIGALAPGPAELAQGVLPGWGTHGPVSAPPYPKSPAPARPYVAPPAAHRPPPPDDPAES